MNRTLILGAALALVLTACSHQVGSDGWCQSMKGKPKGDWSANEAADFAKYCIFK